MTSRRTLLLTLGSAVLGGCSAGDEAIKVADEAARAADDMKYVAPVADEGIRALEQTNNVTITGSIDGSPAYKERQAVLLQTGQYFAERFEAPENARLIFRIIAGSQSVSYFENSPDLIGISTGVFQSEEYQEFKKGVKAGTFEEGTPLTGSRDGVWFKYSLPSSTSYAIVVIPPDPDLGGGGPDEQNIQLIYAIYPERE